MNKIQDSMYITKGLYQFSDNIAKLKVQDQKLNHKT